jgi:hypothetical protein
MSVTELTAFYLGIILFYSDSGTIGPVWHSMMVELALKR